MADHQWDSLLSIKKLWRDGLEWKLHSFAAFTRYTFTFSIPILCVYLKSSNLNWNAVKLQQEEHFVNWFFFRVFFVCTLHTPNYDENKDFSKRIRTGSLSKNSHKKWEFFVIVLKTPIPDTFRENIKVLLSKRVHQPM